MAKYKYREGSYGYEEPIGFESIRSMIDDEISDNKKTDAQQSEDIENEGEERKSADEQIDQRLSALEEQSGSSSELKENFDEFTGSTYPADKEALEAKDSELAAKDAELETAIAEKANAADVEELQNAMETLNGEGEGSIKKIAEDAAVAEVAKVVAEAPEDLDTLKEVADYIASDKTKASEIETKLSDHDSAIEALGAKDNSLEAKDEELAAKDAELEAAIAEKADASALEEEIARAEAAEQAINTKVDAKADNDALDAEIARAMGKESELQAAIAEKASNDSLTEEKERAEAAEEALDAKVETKADASTVAGELTELKNKDAELEAKDAAQDEEIAKKVEWTESTPGRNHIVLKNHDSILGTATDGTTYNVAMVSKWDVADFGTAQLHANLNSKDGIVTINDDKAVATKDEVEAVETKVDAIDLTPYAKSEDVNAELANKANASDLSALNTTVEELSSKVEEKALQSDLEAEVVRAEAKEAELTAKDEAQDAEIAKKVDWVESILGRKHIVLKNHDSILGTATDGMTYNLAMVSKWDVADFGSAQLHANLNSKDGSVTINDDKVVATKDEVEAVDAKVNAIDLTPFAKTEDMNAVVEALNAKDAELEAAIPTAAAQEAAIPTAAAQAVAQVVANAPEDLDTLKEVADYIASDKTKAAEIETKLSGLEAKDAELVAKDEAQDAEIALKADSDKVYTKEDVNNTLEGYVPVEQYNELKARLDEIEIMLSIYNAEREAQMDEIISNMSSDNKEVVTETLMESIVVPETTVAYTITAPLTDNSTVELTSPKYMTLINTSKEPVSTTISHEYTEGETTAATSVYLVGDFNTLTIENVSPSVKSGYDAASVKNVVIPETNVKNLSLSLDFQDGATITNNSDKDITIYDKNDSAIALTVVAPNSTVTLSSGQFTTLNAEVSDNTLIIKKNVHITNLNLEKGNAIVEVARQEEVAGIVENYTVADGYSLSHRIYHITNENSGKLGGVGEMILDEDIVRTSSIVAPLAPAYDAVWNLNGHNLTVEGTPKSGVYLNRYASNLEVKGEGVIRAEGSYGLWNSATTGKIIVNDGVTVEAQTHAIYAEKGVIEINGGTFKLTNWADADKDENGNLRFLLNCLDANYKNGTANIIVKGGKFYDFDPANCAAEGVGTSFVADGYVSVMTTEMIDGVEHKVYTVEKA